MNDGSDFFAWLLSTIFFVGLTFFCSDQTVRPVDMTWAVASCEANGGLEKLSADISDLEAICVNGAVFKAEKKAAKEHDQ